MPVFTGSRYSIFARILFVLVEGQEKRLLLRNKSLEKSGVINYVLYIAKQGDRFDTLAQKYGGDSTKWWVIAEVNEFTDFPLDLEPGTELVIPSKAYFDGVS